ncbi:TPA: LPXTG cell wall anchor domain-containing protein [Streptococcus agalactiae]|uniref:LPXTG cell wall anchor domain-containing protein n=1 Tax=Streptococcus agalactiae TaxID=1311 RepID=UPI000B733B82|nr:LPXTG cell wall anchor domain-containing protein [Streptococcus agalactiae]OTG55196.1 cell surface protein [Streptococcus agalactiae]RRA84375.1 LPXTG cell wall anchor domain-containing protein [Streptococcus agalactiae]HEO6650281.1 LPXTG cell wall anchor domain-containing protein [Streptococcus agalactiae]HEO6652223.1 LPXTG cell wall anchor domain-containing protein [Streptococcus agalactiae]HEO6658061.1 LPXTG cell wall anchor domain-containing protein [Streptococcus agalactiae]
MKKSHYTLLIPAALMAASLAMSANGSVAFAEESAPVDSHAVVQPKAEATTKDVADKASQPLPKAAEAVADKAVTKEAEVAKTVEAATTAQPAPEAKPAAEADVAAKKAHIAKYAGVSVDKIQLLDTSEGKALMYPHGNHNHVVLLDKIDLSKPFDDGDSHHHHHDHVIKGDFTFTATVTDPAGKVLSGKDVQVVDTTGERKTLATVKTDAKGQAVFEKLPLGRSLTVLVDGVAQGYTLRTGVDGDKRSSSFTVDGKGTVEPEYSKTPLVVVARDESAEPLAGQEVVLKHRTGRLVETVVTGADGKAVFSKSLLDGTLYDIFVNGKKLSEAMTGAERSVYLDAKDIKKPGSETKPEAPKVPSKPDVKPETKPEAPKVPSKPDVKPETKPEAPKAPSKPGTVVKADQAGKAAVAKPEMKKADNQLPSTGEAVNPFFTAAALAVMATAGVAAVVKRKEEN